MSVSFVCDHQPEGTALTRVCMTGLAGGAASGSRSITRDPEMKKRIETAFRKFRADVLRKQADELVRGENEVELLL